MKFSIERHNNNLINRASHVQREREDLERMVIRVEKLEHDLKFYGAQINLAIKDKKDGFDEDKFGYTRLLNF